MGFTYQKCKKNSTPDFEKRRLLTRAHGLLASEKSLCFPTQKQEAPLMPLGIAAFDGVYKKIRGIVFIRQAHAAQRSPTAAPSATLSLRS